MNRFEKNGQVPDHVDAAHQIAEANADTEAAIKQSRVTQFVGWWLRNNVATSPVMYLKDNWPQEAASSEVEQ